MRLILIMVFLACASIINYYYFYLPHQQEEQNNKRDEKDQEQRGKERNIADYYHNCILSSYLSYKNSFGSQCFDQCISSGKKKEECMKINISDCKIPTYFADRLEKKRTDDETQCLELMKAGVY